MINDTKIKYREAGREDKYKIRAILRTGFIYRRRILTVVIILAILGGGFYLYSRYQSGPRQTSPEEAAEIVEKVGKLILLPQGETPTVATVSDPKKLKEQSFFKNAKLEDKVLIYSQARKIILYRMSENMIIEVASLSSGTQ